MKDALKKHIKALPLDPSKKHVLVLNAQQFTQDDIATIDPEWFEVSVSPVVLMCDGDVRTAVEAYEIGNKEK